MAKKPNFDKDDILAKPALGDQVRALEPGEIAKLPRYGRELPPLTYFPYLGEKVIFYDRERPDGDPNEGRLALVVGEGKAPEGVPPELAMIQHVNLVVFSTLNTAVPAVDPVELIIASVPMIAEGGEINGGWRFFCQVPMPFVMKRKPGIVTAKEVPQNLGNRAQRRAIAAKMRGE